MQLIDIHLVVSTYLQNLPRSWPVMGIVLPAGLCQVLDVCWYLQRNGWTVFFLDQRENVISILDVGKWNLMRKNLKQNHPIGENIAALVDPTFLIVEFWCHPAASARGSCHGNSMLKNPGFPKITQLKNIFFFKE